MIYETDFTTLVLIIILYTLISIITVFGNTLTIIVIQKNRRMQNVTNYFISNLALADIVIGLFVTPFIVSFD
jgi:leucokinin receptor